VTSRRDRLCLPQRLLALTIITLGVMLAACTGGFSSPPLNGPLQPDSGSHDSGNLTAAGATLPAIIYQAWFYDYHRDVSSGVKVNYQSIGSGAGIQQLIEGSVDFAASDAPMTNAEMAQAPDVQHLPAVASAVVVTYNLDMEKPLRLDGPTTAKIFLGEVTRWNDPVIAALNPGTTLPDEAIHVVHRTESSGTTFVFTDWLSKVSPAWNQRIGRTKEPSFPVGIGGTGSEGITRVVKQTPGAIGYVEFNYAATNRLPAALIANHAGEFVAPSLGSVEAAAASSQLPADYRGSITNAAGSGVYPISTFTFLLINRHYDSCDKARVLLHVLWWAYHSDEARSEARSLSYVTLPANLQQRVDATLHAITCDGGEKVLR
jgi:phosphate transport system substrate-binding protein